MAGHAISVGQRLVLAGLGPSDAAHLVAQLSSRGHEVTVLLGRAFADDEVIGAETVHDSGDTADLEAALVLRQPSLCLHLERGRGPRQPGEDVDGVAEEHFALGMRLAHAFAAAGGSSFVYASSHERWVDGLPLVRTTLQDAARHAFGEVLRYYSLQQAFRVLDLGCASLRGRPGGAAATLPSVTALLQAVRAVTLQESWYCQGDVLGDSFVARLTAGAAPARPPRPRLADHGSW